MPLTGMLRSNPICRHKRERISVEFREVKDKKTTVCPNGLVICNMLCTLLSNK